MISKLEGRVLLAIAATGLMAVMSLLFIGSSSGGTALVSGDHPGGAQTPADPQLTAPNRAPEVSRREVTKRGEGIDYAVFHNGEVYRVRSKTRTYIVTHADGTSGTNIVEEGLSAAAGHLPPGDPSFKGVHPTAEQSAQMGRITAGSKEGKPVVPEEGPAA